MKMPSNAVSQIKDALRGYSLTTMAILGAACAAMPGNVAVAADWPTKPITVVMPQGPGSATDVVSRIVFEQVARQIGQPIVISIREGGSGTVGAAEAAAAEPDGHTLLATSSGLTLTPYYIESLRYDPGKDFKAIHRLATVPSVFVTSPDWSYKTLKDFVEAAKAEPDGVFYAAGGIGQTTYIAAEQLALDAGFKAIQLPGVGGSNSIAEVMGKRAHFYFAPAPVAMPLLKDGRVVGLAVNSKERAKAFPDIPTTVEAGYPNAVYTFWIGAFAPAGTPDEIVDRLHTEITAALQVPAVQERLATLGAEAGNLSRAQFQQLIADELTNNAALTTKLKAGANN